MPRLRSVKRGAKLLHRVLTSLNTEVVWQPAAGSAPVVATAPPAAAGSGRVTRGCRISRPPQSPGGDQLKIARADQKSTASAAAAAKADEAAAKARAIREEQDRAAQLKKTNEAIQKALQVQSKAGAAAQKQAEKGCPG